MKSIFFMILFLLYVCFTGTVILVTGNVKTGFSIFTGLPEVNAVI